MDGSSTQGLPTGDTGRIGIGIYRKDPNIVYAVIENDRRRHLSFGRQG